MCKNRIKFHKSIITKEYLGQISKFRCGNDEIDKYLKEKALIDLNSGDGVTKVIIDDSNNQIIAYYTLNCSAITSNSHKKKYYSPAIEIKMFALNEIYQDNKIIYSEDDEEYICDLILSHIIKEIYDFTNETCGAKTVVLYSTDNAKHFYSRNSFECFEPYMEKNDDRYLVGCTPMFFTL